MECSGPLYVQSGVIFGEHVLAVGLLAHFHVGDRIMTAFDVSNLGDGVLRIVVKKCDWDHGRQSARNTAREEQVEAYLSLARRTEIGSLVPRIDGGAVGGGLLLIGGVA